MVKYNACRSNAKIKCRSLILSNALLNKEKNKKKRGKDKKQRGNIQVTYTDNIVYYGILHAHSGHLKNIF